MLNNEDLTFVKKKMKEASKEELVCNFINAHSLYEEIISKYYFDDKNYNPFVVEALIGKSRNYLNNNQLELAYKTTNDLITYDKKHSQDYSLGNAYLLFSEIYFYQNEREKSNEYLKKSIIIANNLLNKHEDSTENLQGNRLNSKIKYHQGFIYYILGSYDKAIVEFIETIGIAELINDNKLFYTCFSMLGLCYHECGFNDKTLASFEKAEQMAMDNNDLDMITQSKISLALEKRSVGNYKQAIEIIKDNLSKRSNLGLNTTKAYNALAMVYFDIGDYDNSSKYFDIALEDSRKLNWLFEQGIILGNIANLFFAEGLINKSKELSEMSITCFDSAEAEVKKVKNLLLYCRILIELNDFSKAREILTEAENLAAKHRSILELTQCQLVEIIIEKGLENYGIAQDLLKRLLTDSTDYEFYDLTVDAYLMLAELFLERYQRKKILKFFTEAQNYLNKAQELSKKASILPKLLQTMIINASLFISNLEFLNAKNILNEAKFIANENNFIYYSDKIKDIENLISDQELLVNRMKGDTLTTPISSIKSLGINEVMNLFSGHQDFDLLNEFKPNNFFITIFKQSMIGPDVVATENLPFKNAREVLLPIGVFYSTAIGQGNRHHQGLFGPLPITDYDEYSSLIYTTIHKDSTQDDDRMKGSSYCLFCIFYQIKYARLFYNRDAIRKAIINILEKLADINDITEAFLEDLKNEIYSSITKR